MKLSENQISNCADLKILIVDDHELHCNGLMAYLSLFPFVKHCDKALNGKTALELLKKNVYDVVFLDVEMPVMDGKELGRIVRRDFKKIKIIVMTAYEKKTDIYDFMEMGVSAYLLKDCLTNEITKAFKIVMEGGRYMSDAVREKYEAYCKERKLSKLLQDKEEELSRTEKKVVTLMCKQLTSDEISAILGTSKSTIDTHRKRIFKKLKIANSIGIAIYAFKNGLFNP